MAKIDITTAKNVIESNPRKAYFKIKNTGGPKGADGAPGATGATGPQGPQGPQGKAATVTIGSTTTLPAGSNATVTNSGDQYDAVLEFGIPTGPQGPTGATGAQGPRGFQGEKGAKGETGAAATITLGSVSTGAAGTDAAIVNTGDEHNAVYNFTIPRGAKGDTGTSPTVSVYGTETLPAGSQATVTNVGTSQDVQLQFGIPQGEAGKNTKLYSSTGQNTDGAMTQKATTDALAPKLEADVVESLPETGEEGKLYLTPKSYTTGTATGNPITITLGEEAGQITDAKLDGDTYQQSYTGKNLLGDTLDGIKSINTNGTWNGNTYTYHGVSFTPNFNGGVLESVSLSGTASSNTTFYIANYTTSDFSNIATVGNDYMLSGCPAGGSPNSYYLRVMEQPYRNLYTDTGSGNTRALPSLSTRATSVQLVIGVDSPTDVTGKVFYPQFEAGSTATAYEPFVGGTASPNPDYPQQIQTVTGEQTVSINGTDYPLDLGSIELCQIGDQQDHIYKDGNDWKIRRAIVTHLFDGSKNDGYYYNADQTNTLAVNLNPDKVDQAAFKYDSTVIKSCFTASFDFVWDISDVEHIYITGANPVTGGYNGNIRLYILKSRLNGYSPSLTNAQKAQLVADWLTSNPMKVYYIPKNRALTDTTITDTNLIAQLEAVRNATLQASNTITNTATGTNLAGDMELGYYEYNPTNRYDKWLWLDLNNNYEQLGS